MFEQVFDNLRTVTEANMHMQQEMMRKWVGMWPGIPSMPNGGADQFMKFQKKWVEFMAELVKKQREVMEAQFSAGMKNIEEAFRLAEVKNPEELRARTIELWQKIFESMRQAYEAQLRDFQAAAVKWAELMMKGAVPS
jgi:hypothetical protein